MSSFQFRLTFYVHTSGLIEHEERTFDFLLPGYRKAVLRCIDSESISKSKKFELLSGGYATEEDAFKVGRRVKDSLLLCGLKLRLGIDAGRDTSGFILSNGIKKEIFEQHGVKIIEDVHGLTVFSEKYPTTWPSASIRGSVAPANRQDAEKFTGLLSEIYTKCLKLTELTEKERLALDLYKASHYEKSAKAKFLTLVMSIEALLEQKERGSPGKEVVDELIRYTKSSRLNNEEKYSIIGSLRWLYKQSISQSLKEMAERHLGDREYGNMSAKKFITHCYDIRSNLLHDGSVNNKEVQLSSLVAQLDRFMSDLLAEMMGI
jgi:hypothetical protein